MAPRFGKRKNLQVKKRVVGKNGRFRGVARHPIKLLGRLPAIAREGPPVHVESEPWASCYAFLPGRRRSSIGLPPFGLCQDYCTVRTERRTTIVLADGLGSAQLSSVGAEASVEAVADFILSRDDFVARALDTINSVVDDELTDFAHEIGKMRAQVFNRLSLRYLKDPSDFYATLLVMVIGAARSFWVCAGDGEIVVEEKGGVRVLRTAARAGPPNVVPMLSVKGEIPPFGVLDSTDLVAVAVMSDGAAEKLVSTDGRSIAGRLVGFFELLRSGKLNEGILYDFLSDPIIWRETSGDDKSICVAAKIPPSR
jgi:hypothetical protein